MCVLISRWGQRRNASNWQQPLDALQKIEQFSLLDNTLVGSPITTRGFTGHEMLDDMNIIHMNGRIYDAKIGRFLQADPHVKDPTMSQGLNRYAYLHNNPLNATDPTGYFLESLWEKIKPYAAIIVATVLIVATAGAAGLSSSIFLSNVWGAASLGLLTGAISAATSGADGTGVLKGAFFGALSGAAFYGAGAAFREGGLFYSLNGAEKYITQTLVHGVTGGVMATLQGGKFGHGFATSGLAKGFGIAAKGLGTTGQFFAATIAGGTASKVTGGKFANGATTAALAFAVNQLATNAAEQKGNGIQVTDDFEFTEEHARATLKRFWGEAGRIRGMNSDQLSAWLDGQGSLTQEQMNAAFSLATDMAYAGESAELLGKIYSAGRNPTKILKVLATERVNTGELIENIQENWSDTLGSWNPITRHTTVSAGQLNMVRVDSPHNYELFR